LAENSKIVSSLHHWSPLLNRRKIKPGCNIFFIVLFHEKVVKFPVLFITNNCIHFQQICERFSNTL